MPATHPTLLASGCDATGGFVRIIAVLPSSSPTDPYVYELTDSLGGSVFAGVLTQSDLPLTLSPLADGSYTLTVTPDGGVPDPQGVAISCAVPGGGGGPPPPPAPVLGCTIPNAFNYDPAATQDTSPTSCVFVLVDIFPNQQLVAAHLPIPLQLRAAPTLSGLAAIVVILLETAPTLATPDADWVEFGRLRDICDDQNVVQFNLSEAAKSLLRLRTPVESGADPSLSVLLRAKYQALDPETLDVLYSGLIGTCRALNAVVQSSSGATITSTPYAELPAGARIWASTATYAGGVTSTLLTRPSNGCTARQFVWLNARGGYESAFFYGRHQHGTDQVDPITYRDAVGADRYASRGTVRPTLQVYSDKVDFATYRVIRGARTSIQVWERVALNEYIPVLVTAESYAEYQEQTDKTYEVNFAVSYPAQLIQTQ
jgi:hypothetical protein